ncbi:hypothetical protein C8Q73DRAFT_191285 [Cubamyces lactineus]|nr:hypothetical protein C8Q73DRAFT_191285 [Cubamyces lactineus]
MLKSFHIGILTTLSFERYNQCGTRLYLLLSSFLSPSYCPGTRQSLPNALIFIHLSPFILVISPMFLEAGSLDTATYDLRRSWMHTDLSSRDDCAVKCFFQATEEVDCKNIADKSCICSTSLFYSRLSECYAETCPGEVSNALNVYQIACGATSSTTASSSSSVPSSPLITIPTTTTKPASTSTGIPTRSSTTATAIPSMTTLSKGPAVTSQESDPINTIPTANPYIPLMSSSSTTAILPLTPPANPAETATAAQSSLPPHRSFLLLAVLLPVLILIALAVIAIIFWKRSSRHGLTSNFTLPRRPRTSRPPTCDKLGEPLVDPRNYGQGDSDASVEPTAQPRLVLNLHREETSRISTGEHCSARASSPSSVNYGDVSTVTKSPSIALAHSGIPIPLPTARERNMSYASLTHSERSDNQDLSLPARTDSGKGGLGMGPDDLRVFESTICTPLIPPTTYNVPGITAPRYASATSSRLDSWNGTHQSAARSSAEFEYGGIASSIVTDSAGPANESGNPRVLVLPWMVGQRLLEIAARSSMTTDVRDKETEPPPPYHSEYRPSPS